jgi:glutathione S-transferase
MKLYGTTTSPFTRRVRIVAAELGEPVEWLDTATETGLAALREISPIRKVPVAIVDGRTLFDSRVIVDWLITTRGHGALAPPSDPWRELNQVNAVDAAIDAVIQLFYLRRDGVAIDDTPFAKRQMDRTDAIVQWLGTEVTAAQLGLAQISVICALEWMDFRKAYPTERAVGLAPIRAAWAERASIAASRPQT